MLHRKYLLFAIGFVALLIPGAICLGIGSLHRAHDDPFSVVQSYLKASYARDYLAAYRYISARDQRVWDAQSYARQFGSFSGFALQLARKLADRMEIWPINQKTGPDRVRFEVGYQAPTADELSSLLFDWDQTKLNALSRPQQEHLLAALEKMEKRSAMVTIKSQETFDLIHEGGRWKIFYHWASASKISFKVALPPNGAVGAQLLNDKLLVKRDEPFEITLKINNRNNQAVTARIIHHVEPRSLENNLEMIACGALLPLVLQPKGEQEISMAYLIREGIRPGAKFTVTYEIKLEPLQPNAGLTNAMQHAPIAR